MSPNSPPELRFAFARITMEAGDSRTVRTILESHDPDAITTALAAAMVGRWSEAEEVLRKALEADKENAVVSIKRLPNQ